MAEPTAPPDSVIAEYNPFKQVHDNLTQFWLETSPAAIRTLIQARVDALRSEIVQYGDVWANGFKSGYIQAQIDAEAP